MANRRMVSVKIIDSAKFIKMPVSTQALYFHLLSRADDDGIVEAFNVMRMVGASEDDLKVLKAKEFVKVLNEDLVTYITDWHEHNLIRADRKVDSIYQGLLLQIVGDVELTQKKERADRRKLLTDGTSHGQPTDSIGKVSLGNGSKEKTLSPECDLFFEECWTIYPNKKGKGQIKDKSKYTAYGLGEEFKRCIQRYIDTKEDWKQWQNGSTFWNSGYVDFLDKNYIEVVNNPIEIDPQDIGDILRRMK